MAAISFSILPSFPPGIPHHCTLVNLNFRTFASMNQLGRNRTLSSENTSGFSIRASRKVVSFTSVLNVRRPINLACFSKLAMEKFALALKEHIECFTGCSKSTAPLKVALRNFATPLEYSFGEVRIPLENSTGEIRLLTTEYGFVEVRISAKRCPGEMRRATWEKAPLKLQSPFSSFVSSAFLKSSFLSSQGRWSTQ